MKKYTQPIVEIIDFVEVVSTASLDTSLAGDFNITFDDIMNA